MLSCPRVGCRVVLRYAARMVAYGAAPHHEKAGIVIARKTRGRPRNHSIRLDDGTAVVVPAGNLYPYPAAAAAQPEETTVKTCDQWRVGDQKTYVPYELAPLYAQARHRVLHSRVLRDHHDVLLCGLHAAEPGHLHWVCVAKAADIARWAEGSRRIK